jgi:hypothetical protein
VEHNNTAARQQLVPATLLAVLDDIVFALATVVAQQVGSTLVRQRRQVGNGRSLEELLGRQPVHQPPLVGRIATGLESLAVVVAVIHNIPFFHY